MKRILEMRGKNHEAMMLTAAIVQFAARDLPRGDYHSEVRFRDSVYSACEGMLAHMSSVIRHYEQKVIEAGMLNPFPSVFASPKPLDSVGEPEQENS